MVSSLNSTTYIKWGLKYWITMVWTLGQYRVRPPFAAMTAWQRSLIFETYLCMSPGVIISHDFLTLVQIVLVHTLSDFSSLFFTKSHTCSMGLKSRLWDAARRKAQRRCHFYSHVAGTETELILMTIINHWVRMSIWHNVDKRET